MYLSNFQPFQLCKYCAFECTAIIATLAISVRGVCLSVYAAVALLLRTRDYCVWLHVHGAKMCEWKWDGVKRKQEVEMANWIKLNFHTASPMINLVILVCNHLRSVSTNHFTDGWSEWSIRRTFEYEVCALFFFAWKVWKHFTRWIFRCPIVNAFHRTLKVHRYFSAGGDADTINKSIPFEMQQSNRL